MLHVKKHFAFSNTQTIGYSTVIGNLITRVITMKKMCKSSWIAGTLIPLLSSLVQLTGLCFLMSAVGFLQF